VDNNQQLQDPVMTDYQAERARAEAAKAIYHQTTVSRARVYTILAYIITILAIITAIVFAYRMNTLYTYPDGDQNMAVGVMALLLIVIFVPILLVSAAVSIFLFVHSRKLRTRAAGILSGKEFIPDLTAVSDSIDTKRRRRYINYAVISGVGIVVLLKLLGIF
jgi:putative flippase GtrA